MRRFSLYLMFLAGMFGLSAVQAGGKNMPDPVKEALQEMNDYIGGWKGNGTFADPSKLDIWREDAEWSWRFRGKESWLRLTISKGKHFKGGDLRFLPDKETYQFTAVDQHDKTLVFEGALKKNALVLERKDPATQETQQLSLNTAAGGIRFILAYKVKPANRTLFNDQFKIAFTKDGESFATAKKKVECIVTGGLGTMPVNFNGETYYVCCSGCRDAFNENPAKYVAEWKAKLKKGTP